MSLNNLPTNVQYTNGPMIDVRYFLAHADEPADNYERYLSQGAKPKDKYNNERNLFDDSNTKDAHWLKIAKHYLNRYI